MTMQCRWYVYSKLYGYIILGDCMQWFIGDVEIFDCTSWECSHLFRSLFLFFLMLRKRSCMDLRSREQKTPKSMFGRLIYVSFLTKVKLCSWYTCLTRRTWTICKMRSFLQFFHRLNRSKVHHESEIMFVDVFSVLQNLARILATFKHHVFRK